MIRKQEEKQTNLLPTLDEFLAWGQFPNNAYLNEPGFQDLYVRKGAISVSLDDHDWKCTNVLTIARVAAKHPGRGSFTNFVQQLLAKELAVYVENVHMPRFQRKLLNLGFTQVNKSSGLHFLYNYEGHLEKW